MAPPDDTLLLYRNAAADDFKAATRIQGGARPLAEYISGAGSALGELSPRTIRMIAEDLGVELTSANLVAERAHNAPLFTACASDSPYFGFAVRGLVARELGTLFASTLGRAGQSIEMKFDPPPSWADRRPCVVTIARNEGATPDALRREAEAELKRAIAELNKVGVAFTSSHRFAPEVPPDLAAAREAGLPEDNCRVDVTTDPCELFCTACNARQPLPAYFSEPIYAAMADAFYATHGNRRCAVLADAPAPQGLQ